MKRVAAMRIMSKTRDVSRASIFSRRRTLAVVTSANRGWNMSNVAGAHHRCCCGRVRSRCWRGAEGDEWINDRMQIMHSGPSW